MDRRTFLKGTTVLAAASALPALPTAAPTFAKGGLVPPGKWGVVGEAGPVFVTPRTLYSPMAKLCINGGPEREVGPVTITIERNIDD
jgi:hypothetical protein